MFVPPPLFFFFFFLHVLGPDPDPDPDLNTTPLQSEVDMGEWGGLVVERRSRVRVPTGVAGEFVFFSMVNFLC